MGVKQKQPSMKNLFHALLILAACTSGNAARAAGKQPKAPHAAQWVTVHTSDYTLQLPPGWKIGPQTPFGQRTIAPSASAATQKQYMTAMTAPGPAASSWQQLYHTALFFITRQNPSLKPTPYRLWRSPQGMQACSWEMKNSKGQVCGLYTVLRDSSMHILALSVHIPDTASQKMLTKCFQHMVNTAVLHPAGEKTSPSASR